MNREQGKSERERKGGGGEGTISQNWQIAGENQENEETKRARGHITKTVVLFRSQRSWNISHKSRIVRRKDGK